MHQNTEANSVYVKTYFDITYLILSLVQKTPNVTHQFVQRVVRAAEGAAVESPQLL